MATIAKLPIGHTETLTAIYKATESDMGRDDVTCTATARSARTEVTGTSAAITMEAVRRALKLTKTVANTPDDGKAYAPGEDVEFDIKTENTGNQTLSGVEVTEQTEGVSIVEGDGYTLKDGTAKIATLAPKQFVTVDSVKHVGDNDAELESWRNTAQGKIGEIIQNGVSPVVLFKYGIPKNPADFSKAKSWEDAKAWAEDCAGGNQANYQTLVQNGAKKSFNLSGYGDVNMQLVALNNKDKADNSGKAGFVLLSEEIILRNNMWIDYNTKKLWNDCNVRTQLFGDNGTIVSAIPQEIKSVAVKIKNVCASDTATRSGAAPATTIIEETWFLPSYTEIFGSVSPGSWLTNPPIEGKQFDYYVTHNTLQNRIKNELTAKTAYYWWLRTPYVENIGHFGFAYVTTIGTADYNTLNGAYGVVLCFCI